MLFWSGLLTKRKPQNIRLFFLKYNIDTLAKLHTALEHIVEQLVCERMETFLVWQRNTNLYTFFSE